MVETPTRCNSTKNNREDLVRISIAIRTAVAGLLFVDMLKPCLPTRRVVCLRTTSFGSKITLGGDDVGCNKLLPRVGEHGGEAIVADAGVGDVDDIDDRESSSSSSSLCWGRKLIVIGSLVLVVPQEFLILLMRYKAKQSRDFFHQLLSMDYVFVSLLPCESFPMPPPMILRSWDISVLSGQQDRRGVSLQHVEVEINCKLSLIIAFKLFELTTLLNKSDSDSA